MNEIETKSPLTGGEHVLDVAPNWLKSGRQLALATVTETWGSAPQPRGSQLLIDASGNFLGSVSGGCVEGSVVTEAADVIKSEQPKELEFGVSDTMAWEVGLACGGTIRVWVEPLGGSTGLTADMLGDLNAARAARTPVALKTRLDGSGSDLVTRDIVTSSDGLAEDFADGFVSDLSRVVDHGGVRTFLHIFNPSLRMVVIGAVHIAQFLAPMAQLGGYDVTIIDPREAFASKERFPNATVIADWPDDVLPGLGLDARSALVLLTHDPKIDDTALEVALKTECLYIGALGSKKTHARRIERMKDLGFKDTDIARIHGPIGLDIGARGPNEIAIAILGEVTATVRGAGN